MKLIIDIPDDMQEVCKWHIDGIGELTNIEIEILAEAVVNGVGLPCDTKLKELYDRVSTESPETLQDLSWQEKIVGLFQMVTEPNKEVER